APAAHDDERLDHPDGPHDLAHDVVPSPTVQCILAALAETEIPERAVQHLAAIDLARLETLPGSNDAECVRFLRPAAILSAFSTCRGPIDRSHADPMRQVGNHAAVFVVGVRTELQDGPRHSEALDP